MVKYKKVYLIYDTEENSFVSINNKCRWTKAGNAKSAWSIQNTWKPNHKAFNEQSRYIIKEVSVETL